MTILDANVVVDVSDVADVVDIVDFVNRVIVDVEVEIDLNCLA